MDGKSKTGGLMIMTGAFKTVLDPFAFLSRVCVEFQASPARGD